MAFLMVVAQANRRLRAKVYVKDQKIARPSSQRCSRLFSLAEFE